MAKDTKHGGAFAAGAQAVERMAFFKETAGVITNFLEKSKDHPIFKFIEEQFRGLREEIITYKLINEMEQEKKERIDKFLMYLLKKGETVYIQDIQNIVFTLVIFENVGVPLTQVKSDTVPESHKKFDGTGKNKLLTTDAKKFLNELSELITNGADETAYKAAMKYLSSHRMIGQHQFKLQFGKLWKLLENLGANLPSWIKNDASGAISNFWKKQFPEDKPGGFDFLLEKLKASQRRRGLIP
jgi:hypothetical protein